MLNNAAFEWIHHEHVGRAAGLTTSHLAAIADTSITSSSVLSPLQQAALAFTDASTRYVSVSDEVFANLKHQLQANLDSRNDDDALNVTVDRQLVEATATVGGYNLVSRFLVALNVDDRASQAVPVPRSPDQSVFEYPVLVESPDVVLYVRVHFHENPKAPAIIFINSLLTNVSMWDRVLPFFADSYTIITFDQRGHGQSSCPPNKSTIPRLAQDVANILDYLQIKVAHGVVGVSQGGATALSFGLQYPHRVQRLVACDTQVASPVANKAAWDERIALARSGPEGMHKLAIATVARWFPKSGPSFAPTPGGRGVKEGFGYVSAMIARTDVEGFANSAAALKSYDLRADGLIDVLRNVEGEDGMRVLLLAGELDGKLPQGLKDLRHEIGGGHVEFVEIKDSGHLPMLDNLEEFGVIVSNFLKS